MNTYQLIVVGCGLWFIGLMGNAMVRFDYPQEDTNHQALGKSILWPLFLIRFIVLSLWEGLKALVVRA